MKYVYTCIVSLLVMCTADSVIKRRGRRWGESAEEYNQKVHEDKPEVYEFVAEPQPQTDTSEPQKSTSKENFTVLGVSLKLYS